MGDQVPVLVYREPGGQRNAAQLALEVPALSLNCNPYLSSAFDITGMICTTRLGARLKWDTATLGRCRGERLCVEHV